MKKIIICVLLLATAWAFGQQNPKPAKHTSQEIWKILALSLNANQAGSITDLNTIYVGDNCKFQLKDGRVLAFIARKGDTYWWLGEAALEYQDTHPGNPIVAPGSEDKNGEQKEPTTVPIQGGSNLSLDKVMGIVLAIVTIAALIFLLTLAEQKRKRKQREASEKLIPLVRDGVSDRQAPEYMRQMGTRRNLTITGPTERGRLTTRKPIEMAYVGTRRMETFENEPFFRARARKNDTNQEVYAYFRQVCGNDATVIGDDDVIWILEAQSTELQEANLQAGTPTAERIRQSQDDTTAVVKPVDAVALLELLKTAVEKTEAKDSAKVECEAPNFRFSLEFSKNMILPTNHVQKETPAAQSTESTATN